MPKNIVVFSDGTGQEGGKLNNTNVYKLFNMVLDRSPEQVVYYDAGLGTGWRKFMGMAFGMGISKNIRDCYQFIFENYVAGDKIYLFGFSRGATTVRSLSSFIHVFGILPKSRPELIKRAYKIYKTRNKHRRDVKAKKFIALNHTMWCRLEFLGVWDTVAALGIPWKAVDVIVDKIPWFQHKFQDLRLAESVRNGYHALAIDDQRKTFHPTLWDKELAPHQTVKQVWFCGMHTDVGGGYAEMQLSDIPLAWMTRMAMAHGLRLWPRHKVTVEGNVNGKMHDSRGTFLSKLYRKAERTWDSATCGPAVVHESVLARTRNPQNGDEPPYRPWILDPKYDHRVESGPDTALPEIPPIEPG
jgi:uncharacterized protein (DUF2235 family)